MERGKAKGDVSYPRQNPGRTKARLPGKKKGGGKNLFFANAGEGGKRAS